MKKSLYLLSVVTLIFTLFVSSCSAPVITPIPTQLLATQVSTETPAATQTPTEAPTETPIAIEPFGPDLGTTDAPLIMALPPSATSRELQVGGEAIIKKLSEMTEYTIKFTVLPDYAVIVEEMGASTVHIGWLPPLVYMLAREKGYADVGLIVLRADSDHYGFQFVANADRKNDHGAPMFKSYVDPITGESTADAATALKQFEDKKPCYTDPFSASGYVLPAGLLAKEGVKTQAGAWVQGYPTVIKSIYLSPKGEICDFGATFIDARMGVTKDFPDVNDKVQVLYVSDPIIPNENVSFASNVPIDVREKVSQALLDLASTEEGRALLKKGGYDIGGLKAVDDTFYDDFRVYLKAAGYDVMSYK